MIRCLAVALLSLMFLVAGPLLSGPLLSRTLVSGGLSSGLCAQDPTPEPGSQPTGQAPAEPAEDSPATPDEETPGTSSEEPPEPPEPATPSTPEELEHLARQYLGGSDEARDLLRRAGVPAVAALRTLSAGESPGELQALVALVAVDALAESLARDPGLVYRGQFQAYTSLGHEGVTAFLAIFRDEDQTQVARTRAAIALGDIAPAAAAAAGDTAGAAGDTASDTLAPVLRAIIADFLSEPWFEQEAGYLLVRVGDRSYVDPLIERWEKVATLPPTRLHLAELLDAHSELAEVHYRIGAYPEAIANYQKKAAILEDVLERVVGGMRLGLEAELALLYYNLACSQSLAGRTHASRTSLERALIHAEVEIKMIESDGDLHNLRAADGHNTWLQTMRTRKQATPEPTKPAPAEDPPPAGNPAPDS